MHITKGKRGLMGGVIAACWLGLGVLGMCKEPKMPMQTDEKETTTYRWLRKPVLESRLLDDMEQPATWAHFGQGRMSLTDERAHQGKQSVRLQSPTIIKRPNNRSGRPFGEAVARRVVPGENWTNYNRISVWVYPHLPGFKVISLLVKLRNEGTRPVPDSYGREGLHYVILKPDVWNQVVWEIPHLARDKVTGVELIYRLQGHEPGAAEEVCFDFDQLELQRVEPDHFEGWTVAPGQIAFSHSGYLPESRKVALANTLDATEFKVVEQGSGKTVVQRPIEREKSDLGTFQVLDFSLVTKPGIYRLEASGTKTPWFRIGEDAWEPSIWKTINLFYCERCGTPVEGIHAACHLDWRVWNQERELPIHGGWHDAGDLSQGLVNTAEATYAMLDLARRLEERNSQLSKRLVNEARWGLEWILKTRFGDGTRVTWATMDYWTDGKTNTLDDTFGDARNSPYDNFIAASTEALAARVLTTSDPALAQRALKAAIEDWRYANGNIKSPNLELAAAAAMACMELYHATGSKAYGERAQSLARVILDSQQREWPDWKIPLVGFFYTGLKRERFLHYMHRGHEQAPVVALAEMLRSFPDHPDWMTWYAAVVLHSEYLKSVAAYDAPYGMIPASVYSVKESNDPRFQEQVRQGVRLTDDLFLRRFPVWFDFRGNEGTVLSQTKALSTAGKLRRDRAAMDLVQQQLEWAVGRNPFCQSLMWGEGHDYAPQYTAMSGDMVGSLPVGIQTRENLDVPYWPTANCYNYKEVWVHPSSRWLWVMADYLDRPEMNKPSSLGFELRADDGGETVTVKALLKGKGRHRLALRGHNLRCERTEQVVNLGKEPQTVTWQAKVVSSREPWIGFVVPNGQVAAGREVLGLRRLTRKQVESFSPAKDKPE